MARGERNARYEDRFPTIDPWFGREAYGMGVGYLRSSEVDSSGYTIGDSQLAGRLREGPIGSEVEAPLGGPMVGRLAVSSYGGPYHPTPGGALADLEEYARFPALPEVAAAGEGSHGGLPLPGRGGPAEAGAASTRPRLGVPPGEDDTGYRGIGDGPLFLGEQHAIGRAPLPMDGGSTSEHVLSRLRGRLASGIYDGGDGVGFGAYGRGMGGDYGDGSAEERLDVLPRNANVGFEDEGGDGWPKGMRRRPSSVDELDT